MDLIRKKDNKFIELLYDHYSDSLYGVIRRIIANEDVAKDVLQDSMVKIWKKADQYDPERSKLFTWILRICRNTAIDRMRSEQARKERENQNALENVDKFDKSWIQSELIDMPDHLDTIDSKYRDVIHALFYKGMTQDEASKQLNIPLGTVKTRLKIGLRELRKIFIEKQILMIILSLLFI